MTHYTLDHVAGNRILAESTPTHTVLYLYSGGGTGTDVCLGEIRAGVPRYYLPDAAGYVRQGVDTDGAVASSWLFDPDGTVLEGPDGPVSHLVCGGVYDRSTGLLYQGGSYFDPRLGIWLALLPLVVLQAWPGRKKRKEQPWVVVVCMGLFVMGTLAACSSDTENILDAICTDNVPEVGFAKLAIRTNQSPSIKMDYTFDEAIRFGEAIDDPLKTGVYIQAQAFFPKGQETHGNLVFGQYIASRREYYFGKFEHTSSKGKQFVISESPEIAGDLNTWYEDKEPGDPFPYPVNSEEFLSKSGACPGCEKGELYVGYFLDAPGSGLRMVKKNAATSPPPLLARISRIDQFMIYVFWEPNNGPVIPIAKGTWGWAAEVKATPNPEVPPKNWTTC